MQRKALHPPHPQQQVTIASSRLCCTVVGVPLWCTEICYKQLRLGLDRLHWQKDHRVATDVSRPCNMDLCAEWTDFWGTVVDYYNESPPSSNRKMHRHLLQASSLLLDIPYFIYACCTGRCGSTNTLIGSQAWLSLPGNRLTVLTCCGVVISSSISSSKRHVKCSR